MDKIIDLKATMKTAGNHYTKEFLSNETGKSWQTINNYWNEKTIPKKANKQLCNIFIRNKIEVTYR